MTSRLEEEVTGITLLYRQNDLYDRVVDELKGRNIPVKTITIPAGELKLSDETVRAATSLEEGATYVDNTIKDLLTERAIPTENMRSLHDIVSNESSYPDSAAGYAQLMRDVGRDAVEAGLDTVLVNLSTMQQSGLWGTLLDHGFKFNESDYENNSELNDGLREGKVTSEEVQSIMGELFDFIATNLRAGGVKHVLPGVGKLTNPLDGLLTSYGKSRPTSNEHYERTGIDKLEGTAHYFVCPPKSVVYGAVTSDMVSPMIHFVGRSAGPIKFLEKSEVPNPENTALLLSRHALTSADPKATQFGRVYIKQDGPLIEKRESIAEYPGFFNNYIKSNNLVPKIVDAIIQDAAR